MSYIQVMRNRESAQRSRNQRKNELLYLQTRVGELEEENRRLREQTPQLDSSPSTSMSSLRQATPEQKVLSLAGDLGIPPSMVSAGVNMSSVAPRHTEPELPVIKEEPNFQQHTPSEIDRLISENRALLERIQTLESLVKQVVAMSDFSTVNVPSTTTQQTLAPPQQTSQPETFDFTSFVNPTTDETPLLSTTQTTPSLSLTTPLWSSTETNSNHPIACHSAAVAISDLSLPDKGETQQRAKGTGLILHPSLITKERLSLVARVIVASAKMRGWTLEGSSAWEKPIRSVRRRNPNSRVRRKAQWNSGRRN
jgi:hypothetical protein